MLGEAVPSRDHWVRFPRTAHLPWSPGASSDDKILPTLDAFQGERTIATVKWDGENASLYRDHYHARSLDSAHHPSRDWLKSFWGTIRYEIPERWRMCGENLYARHSIAYADLPTYFLGFHVWDDRNVCLGWDETLEWFKLLGITPVNVIYDGPFDLARIRKLHEMLDTERQEGFVLRVAGEIVYDDYRRKVTKWVRPKHVQTDQHWMHGPIIRNELRQETSRGIA